jgi:hypothetical protein
VSSTEAERRQLTVLFCDLVDSTALARQLDPEAYRDVVRAYQATCAEVIRRFDGNIAQYLGDGLLVYFGYPQAHEDDAQRAGHAGLDIVESISTTLNPRLEKAKGVQLAVRIGIHTGAVVVGAMGGGSEIGAVGAPFLVGRDEEADATFSALARAAMRGTIGPLGIPRPFVTADSKKPCTSPWAYCARVASISRDTFIRLRHVRCNHVGHVLEGLLY